tara:strand:- start:1105 stop:1269 length:165 start_codon:yes stop_codon:yes gene_type:complete
MTDNTLYKQTEIEQNLNAQSFQFTKKLLDTLNSIEALKRRVTELEEKLKESANV